MTQQLQTWKMPPLPHSKEQNLQTERDTKLIKLFSVSLWLLNSLAAITVTLFLFVVILRSGISVVFFS